MSYMYLALQKLRFRILNLKMNKKTKKYTLKINFTKKKSKNEDFCNIKIQNDIVQFLVNSI